MDVKSRNHMLQNCLGHCFQCNSRAPEPSLLFRGCPSSLSIAMKSTGQKAIGDERAYLTYASNQSVVEQSQGRSRKSQAEIEANEGRRLLTDFLSMTH